MYSKVGCSVVCYSTTTNCSITCCSYHSFSLIFHAVATASVLNIIPRLTTLRPHWHHQLRVWASFVRKAFYLLIATLRWLYHLERTLHTCSPLTFVRCPRTGVIYLITVHVWVATCIVESSTFVSPPVKAELLLMTSSSFLSVLSGADLIRARLSSLAFCRTHPTMRHLLGPAVVTTTFLFRIGPFR